LPVLRRRPAGRTRGCLLRSTPETSRRLRSQIRESPDSPGRFIFLTAQAAAKAMVKQGQGGVIINTASMSGHIINVPQQVSHYCASKAAVIHLTKAMAVELAPHKIRVNSVSPGYILTELVEPYTEYQPLWEPKIPLGRLGRPEELAGLYLYLASEASSYMTGSDIVIDGGYTCP
ncbi:SDR family oxidoreductase, partial [Mycobacterium tuberculosis]